MKRQRTTSTPELLIELRREGSTAPVHRQIEHGLRRAIRSGRLPAGTPLPSSRALAGQLGISRGVVVEAYEQLAAEGYLTSERGSATRVAPRAFEPAPQAPSETRGPDFRVDFAYGRPDVTMFPRSQWLHSIRRVLGEAPSDRLSYLDPMGAPELREALAVYLNRVRGTAASAERIVICNGYAQALSLIAEVLKTEGVRVLATEDPGYHVPSVAARAGLGIVPVPVDEQGVDVSALRATPAEAIVVTPAHHFPTGAVLSADRRRQLVDWAVGGGRLIVEDDYDAEFRYDRAPIGAMQGLAPDHVLYAGTASKTLAPGLRLGWVIGPAEFVRKIGEVKYARDGGSPGLEQLTFADFLSRGDFDRHLRHMRAIYDGRREVLLESLGRYAPELRPSGASAGLHLVAWLREGVDEAEATRRAAELGVRIAYVGRYRLQQGGPGGLLFGYGTVTEAQIVEGVRVVGEVVRELIGRPE
jgi:GntR family transcriptional regulator/MocR family aminotransferase